MCATTVHDLREDTVFFATPSAWAVKVWDGATGELLCADARQPPGREDAKSELTSMCLGTRGRKIILGDGIGRIKVRSTPTAPATVYSYIVGIV